MFITRALVHFHQSMFMYHNKSTGSFVSVDHSVSWQQLLVTDISWLFCIITKALINWHKMFALYDSNSMSLSTTQWPCTCAVATQWSVWSNFHSLCRSCQWKILKLTRVALRRNSRWECSISLCDAYYIIIHKIL